MKNEKQAMKNEKWEPGAPCLRHFSFFIACFSFFIVSRVAPLRMRARFSTLRRMADRANEGAWKPTACILCECNCGLEVELDGRRLARLRGDKAHPASQGYA